MPDDKLRIDRVGLLEYEEFYKSYLLKNRPCIFSSELTENWKCRKEWVNTDGSLNIPFLRNTFGEAEVPVTDCLSQDSYGSSHRTTQKLTSFLEYLEQPSDQRTSCLYLKDWHFQRAFPDYRAYEVPLYFSSDWLNEWCDYRFSESTDKDYRFLYLGPKGSCWSSNISGRKKWILLPPGAEERLNRGSGLPVDISNVDLRGIDHAICIQERGETIFVPGGWHHQVWNLEDTLSINHNWINAANAATTFKLLKSTLANVEREIADHRDGFFSEEEWRLQCQAILKGDLGMNMDEFLEILLTINQRRHNRMVYACDWLRKFDLDCVDELLSELAVLNYKKPVQSSARFMEFQAIQPNFGPPVLRTVVGERDFCNRVEILAVPIVS